MKRITTKIQNGFRAFWEAYKKTMNLYGDALLNGRGFGLI
jgi:hypothetical protein